MVYRETLYHILCKGAIIDIQMKTKKSGDFMSTNKYEVNMTEGPLAGKIILYTLPLMLSGILQLLFNAADMIIAGRYAGAVSLAAIGATSSLINLLLNLFIGLSIGANVTVAHFYGAGKPDEVSETVHTSMLLAITGGIAIGLIGALLAQPLLTLMGTPEDILPHSVTYMRIYFAGIPVTLVFNFGSAILRAVGDTKRPLIYLSTAGIINVILNIIFITRLGMGVSGVALATIISQAISALMILKCMTQAEGAYHLDFSKLTFHADKVKRIARIGLPAGVQGMLFSISNVIIQSSVNSFGSIAIAGNTAQANLEGFVYNAMNSFYQSTLSFAGQNVGAKFYSRVYKVVNICLVCVFITGLVMGGGALLFGSSLLSVYSSDPNVIAFGLRRMRIIFATYYLCGMQEVMVAGLRAAGYSIMPTIISLLGACLFRIVWIYSVFIINRSPEILYVSYPISWLLIFIVFSFCFRKYVYKKFG